MGEIHHCRRRGWQAVLRPGWMEEVSWCKLSVVLTLLVSFSAAYRSLTYVGVSQDMGMFDSRKPIFFMAWHLLVCR